jgi:HSP20 family molecular chaperone IbpA
VANESIRPTDAGSKAQNVQNRPAGGSFRDLLGFDPLRGFLPGLSQAPGTFGVEINRTEDGYTVEIPVPGFRPEQIDVTVQEETVMVSGKSDRRNFTRTLILPEDIDPDGISANVDQGMLTLNLHQRPERQPRRITVQSVSANTIPTIKGSSEPSGKEGSQQSTAPAGAAR